MTYLDDFEVRPDLFNSTTANPIGFQVPRKPNLQDHDPVIVNLTPTQAREIASSLNQAADIVEDLRAKSEAQ